MGLFDNIVCEYPLPGNPDSVEWQTKDTPAQYLETYIIAADGTLWHEVYDTEDRSPVGRGEAPTGTWRDLGGCVARVNKRRVPMPDFRGCIEFYGSNERDSWDYSALFDEGKLLNVKLIGGENKQVAT